MPIRPKTVDYREKGEEELDREIARLKLLVSTYVHDRSVPLLPFTPDGSLHGVGFVYDEDRDDRVLIAIDELRAYCSLVAVAENQGTIDIYVRMPAGLSVDIDIASDVWNVREFVPRKMAWVTDKW